MADAHPSGRLTDEEVLRSVDDTIRRVLLPALPESEEWARAAAVQLVGLVRHTLDRGPDRSTERVGEVAAALAALRGNELVDAAWNGDPSEAEVMAAAGRVLVAAVGRDDEAADAVRTRLRPVLVGHLDDEFASTASLVDAFRGRLVE